MKTALVIASYKEIETLPILLEELVKFLNQTDLIVIADDSPSELRPLLEIQCSRILENSGIKSIFSYGQTKSGRGNAIRRGMAEALKLYPDIKYILEMDADSSHQPKDIEYLRDMNSDSDLIIGSRYIYGSEIIGWPISRRFFSKCLNLIIPRILNLKVKDVTNGLRRYTAESAQLILSVEPRNSGFTYLSEQA